MLEAMFSGRHYLKQDKTGFYFIDRDPLLFRHVLAYLRDRKLRLPVDEVLTQDILDEFEYLNIPVQDELAQSKAKELLTSNIVVDKTLNGHTGWVRCLEVVGESIVSGSYDKTVKIWDINTGHCTKVIPVHTMSCIKDTLDGHSNWVLCLDVIGDTIVSGCKDKTIKIWNMRTGQCEKTLNGHTYSVTCLEIAGSTIVSGSQDKTIKIWSMETGECKKTLTGHTNYVMCLQVLRNQIISGSQDNTIKIWDVATGQCKKSLTGHTDAIVCLKAVGNTIVSGSFDKSIKVWNMSTGACHKTLYGHTNSVVCLKVLGNRIVSGSFDKTILLWKCDNSSSSTSIHQPPLSDQNDATASRDSED